MRRVTFRTRGHPNVRAVHAKTIEFTVDADVTARGTCIIGVAADLDPGALAGLAGPVTVTLEAGGAADVVSGTANPGFRAEDGRAVIRRSRHRSPDTLVYGADKGAADLDRALVAALADARAELRVTLAVDDGAGHHVLDPSSTALPLTEREAGRIRDADDVVTRPGTPPSIAAALLAGEPGPVTLAGPLPRRAGDRRRALARHAAATAVWDVRPEDVAGALDDVGDRLVALVTDPGTADEHVHRQRPPAAVRARRVALVVGPGVGGDAVDGDALVAALLGAGVPARTLTQALVDATGATRKDAYDRVLRLKHPR